MDLERWHQSNLERREKVETGCKKTRWSQETLNHSFSHQCNIHQFIVFHPSRAKSSRLTHLPCTLLKPESLAAPLWIMSSSVCEHQHCKTWNYTCVSVGCRTKRRGASFNAANWKLRQSRNSQRLTGCFWTSSLRASRTKRSITDFCTRPQSTCTRRFIWTLQAFSPWAESKKQHTDKSEKEKLICDGQRLDELRNTATIDGMVEMSRSTWRLLSSNKLLILYFLRWYIKNLSLSSGQIPFNLEICLFTRLFKVGTRPIWIATGPFPSCLRWSNVQYCYSNFKKYYTVYYTVCK